MSIAGIPVGRTECLGRDRVRGSPTFGYVFVLAKLEMWFQGVKQFESLFSDISLGH
jgi:hypothetical protein